MRSLKGAAFVAAMFVVGHAVAAPKWDTDGDGEMARAEFTAMSASRVIGRLDKDGDGAVSLDEWKTRPAAAKAKGDPAKRFARMDGNGDGRLDASELATVAERRFTRIDTDKDGILSMEERKARRTASSR